MIFWRKIYIILILSGPVQLFFFPFLRYSLEPDASDCSRYYESGIHHQCSDKTWFNRLTKTCEPIKNTERENMYRCLGCILAHNTLPDINSCGHYWECSFGLIRKKSCPHNERFNAQSSTCETTRLTVGHSKMHCEDRCPRNSKKKISNPEDKRSYLQCVEGYALPLTCCPKREDWCYFNSEKEECEKTDEKCSLTSKARFALAGNESKYHQCEEGQLKVVTCCEKNPDLCKFDEKTKECVNTSCPENEVKPDTTNCTGYFKCSNNEQKHQTCPDNLWFNFKTKTCESIAKYPENHGCGDERCSSAGNKTFPVQGDDQKYLQCEKGLIYSKFCCSEYPNRCRFDEPTAQCMNMSCTTNETKPDTENCTRYYECRNNVQKHQTCPDNLWFNFKTNTCESIAKYPENHGCGDERCSSAGNKTFPVPGDDHKYMQCDKGLIYSKFCCSEYPNRCRFDKPTAQCINMSCPANEIKPDTKNCTRYYNCSDGVQVHKTCPDKLWFNLKTKTCVSIADYPSDHGCGDERCASGGMKKLPLSGDKRKYLQCQDGLIYSKFCCNDDPSRCQFNNETKKCVDITTCAENEIKPDTKNCTRYYKCSDSVQVHKTCPDQLWFNFNTKTCESIAKYPENHGCGDDRCSSAGNEMLPLPGDERKYLQCKEGLIYSKFCCDDNPNRCQFDVDTKRCANMSTCSENEIKPDTKNCTRYYKCSNGVQVRKTCPDKLWFNFKTRTCESIAKYPENQGCGDKRCIPGFREKLPLPGDERKYLQCKDGLIYSKFCCDDHPNRCRFDNRNKQCLDMLCSEEGKLIQDPKNRSSYYKCSHGLPNLMTCPNKLWYNPETHKCDHIATFSAGNENKGTRK